MGLACLLNGSYAIFMINPASTHNNGTLAKGLPKASLRRLLISERYQLWVVQARSHQSTRLGFDHKPMLMTQITLALALLPLT